MTELIPWGVLIALILLLIVVTRISDNQTAKRWDVFRDNNPELAKKLEDEGL